jgi:hypothetical protein
LIRIALNAHPTYDSQGRLGLALVRDPGTVSTLIEPVDLVDAPTLNPQGWPDTFNETYVRFTNRDKRFQEDSVAYRDRGNFQITQTVLAQTLSRLWITRQAVAQKIANAAGRVAAQPLLSGTMRVRKSSGAKLTVGGLFQLNFPQSGAEGVLCRVERLALPAPGQSEATVSFAEDTGFFNGDHYAAVADIPPTENVFEVQALAYERLIEAPWGLAETNTPRIVFLAARGDTVSNGFNVWKQRSDLSYRQVADFESFAQRGHVVAEYPADTLLIDDHLGIDDPVRLARQRPGRIHVPRGAGKPAAVVRRERDPELLERAVDRRRPLSALDDPGAIRHETADACSRC